MRPDCAAALLGAAPYAHGVVRVPPLAVAVVVVVLVGLAAGCSSNDGHEPSGEPTPAGSSAGPGAEDASFQPDDDGEQIRALLKARGAALEDGDRATFLATIDTRVEGDDPLFRPAVLEQVRLDVDAAPVTNTLENTFVRRDGTWLLGAESVPGKYRDDREPRSRPWAGSVPIAVARSADLVIVVDARREPDAQGLADQLVEDIRFDAQALGIAPSYDVLVDATTVGESHAMSTVGDTDAAAVTFPVTYFDNADNGRLAGIRIKVNPETAAETIADTLVMRHELTHFLTLRRLGGTPTWVKEGLAEWVSTAPSSLHDLVVDGDACAHVAVTHLVDGYGVADVLALADVYRSIDGDDADEKTDRVLRKTLGITEAELVTATWDALATLQRG